MPPPILASPLAIAKPGTPDLKLKGSSSLLISVRKFIEETIKRRMLLIMEAWYVSYNIVSFRYRLNAYNEFLQEYYKNEEGFYKHVVVKFAIKVSNMTELKIREDDFPSLTKMKRLKACWIKKISKLEDIIDYCKKIVNKKEMLFTKLTEIDLAGTTRELKYSRLIINYIFMMKQQFEEHMDILKINSAEKFNSIIEYDESEIEN
jgi:hypothetical protein